MERRPSTVRMGPISVFALVIILCLAVLGVLSVTSASAGSALAQRQAEFAADAYRNEIVRATPTPTTRWRRRAPWAAMPRRRRRPAKLRWATSEARRPPMRASRSR